MFPCMCSIYLFGFLPCCQYAGTGDVRAHRARNIVFLRSLAPLNGILRSRSCHGTDHIIGRRDPRVGSRGKNSGGQGGNVTTSDVTKRLSQNPGVGDPPEIPPPTPGIPKEPPQESPPGSPRPEVPPPVENPARPNPPRELPRKTPDELPVRGPKGQCTPYPANEPDVTDLPGSEPDVNPGAPQLPPGTM